MEKKGLAAGNGDEGQWGDEVSEVHEQCEARSAITGQLFSNSANGRDERAGSTGGRHTGFTEVCRYAGVVCKPWKLLSFM